MIGSGHFQRGMTVHVGAHLVKVIGVPAVELSPFAKSCLGWSQGASLFLGFWGYFYIFL
jgi:hypothetical protein